jgi:hypothetical protein
MTKRWLLRAEKYYIREKARAKALRENPGLRVVRIIVKDETDDEGVPQVRIIVPKPRLEP